ncbi:MAG: glycosyltransferase family 4 protein [Anaerolineae bacterium]|nr:glycosyltransferase family 4 protein [Anaerolineae bacterium]
MFQVLLVYYEPLPAGQTTHVLALARGLDRARFRSTVVLPAHLEASITAFRNAGARVVPLPLHKILWPPQAIAALLRLIRKEGIDIVHIHSQEAGLLARLVAWTAGARRIIYTPQTLDIRKARWHWLYILIERLLAHLTDTIVSVNEFDRGRLIRWGIAPHKVVTIPNGIDLRQCAEPPDLNSLRQELGVDEGQCLVMQVGGLRAQKAPLAFVEGAHHIVHQRPDVRFALVGDGPLKDAVTKRILELGLERQVRVLGWRSDARTLMWAADVVTLTSRWEGSPHALLEAMACARPVVATAVNGCPEIVLDGVTGFLVPPGDPAAWAGRVINLLDHPEMARTMGERGRKRVEEHFSLTRMIGRIEELYAAER